MTIRGYAATLRSRWRIVVACIAACTLIGIALTVFMPREYESTTTIYVSTASVLGDVNTEYQGGILAQQRIASYNQFLTSARIGGEVSERLRLGMSPAEVTDKMTVVTQPESAVLSLTVRDSSPERAAAIAGTAAMTFAELVAQFEQPLDPTRAPTVISRVLDPAVPNPDPVSPVPALNIGLGLIVGLLLGLAAALLYQAVDTRVRTSDDLDRASGRPTLGVLPDDPSARGELPRTSRDAVASAEAVRQLRANLRFAMVDLPGNVIVVTSPMPGEGKSKVAADLARSFQDDNSRVCLVDADLRRPTLAARFALLPTVGVTSVLAGDLTADQAVQSAGGSLDVLTSGRRPPNPSELLGSRPMTELLDRLREKYDIVILDSAPVLPVADTPTLVSRCDGVVLVARAGRTTGPLVRRAVEALDTASARTLGTVVNGSASAPARSPYLDQLLDDEAVDAVDPAEPMIPFPAESVETPASPEQWRPSPGPRAPSPEVLTHATTKMIPLTATPRATGESTVNGAKVSTTGTDDDEPDS